MRNSRASITNALMTQLLTATFAQPVAGATTWRMNSLKLKVFAEVPLSSRPALFLAKHHEDTVHQSENLPPKLSMLFNAFVYINSKGNMIPAPDLDSIMDAVDAALAPSPATGRQTLGGLVSHCYVDGQTLFDAGDLDGDGLLWIPIRVLGP